MVEAKNGETDDGKVGATSKKKQVQNNNTSTTTSVGTEWKCPYCSLLNPITEQHCQACAYHQRELSQQQQQQRSKRSTTPIISKRKVAPVLDEHTRTMAIVEQEKLRTSEEEMDGTTNGDNTLTPSSSTCNNREKLTSTKGSDEWACPLCTLLNPSSERRCQACTYQKKLSSNNKKNNNNKRKAAPFNNTPTMTMPLEQHDDEDQTTKSRVEKEQLKAKEGRGGNGTHNTASTTRTNTDESKESSSSTTTKEQGEWTCPCCTFINPSTEQRCQVCLLHQKEFSQQSYTNNNEREVAHQPSLTNTTTSTLFDIGDRVVVGNLTSTIELNGLHGIIENVPDSDSTGRYTVHLDTPLGGHISCVGVKAQNLEKEPSLFPPVTTGSTASTTISDNNLNPLSFRDENRNEQITQSTDNNKASSRKKNICIVIVVVVTVLLIGIGLGFAAGWLSKESSDGDECDDDCKRPKVPLPSDCLVIDETKYNICIETASRGTYSGSSSNWTDSVTKAAKRWESIITGNLESVDANELVAVDPKVLLYTCQGQLPPMIDDMYICVQDEKIDGRGSVIGAAGIVVARGNDTLDLPVVSDIYFDEDDIQFVVDNGNIDTLILHEMAHALGFGFFEEYGLLTEDHSSSSSSSSNQYVYNGEYACNEWRNLQGCNGCPPIEHDGGEGTEFGHWDEHIMKNELMTGYVDENIDEPLSRVTIGAFQDLGYAVDYTKADPYQSPCSRSYLRRRHGRRQRQLDNLVFVDDDVPKLSARSKSNAVEYGLKILNKNKKKNVTKTELPEGLLFVGDQYINVIVEENGALFSVSVRNEDEER